MNTIDCNGEGPRLEAWLLGLHIELLITVAILVGRS